jgi:hypothetical protein
MESRRFFVSLVNDVFEVLGTYLWVYAFQVVCDGLVREFDVF